jgi:hypothetical protein
MYGFRPGKARKVFEKLGTVKIKLGYVVGLVVAMVAGGATTAAVLAAIPDGSGVIHGCYSSNFGLLRVIDSATDTCRSGETGLNWNQTGPQGPAGPAGPTGPQGPAGSGGAVAYVHIIRSNDPSGQPVIQIDSSRTSHVINAFPAGSDPRESVCLKLDSTVESKHVAVASVDAPYNAGVGAAASVGDESGFCGSPADIVVDSVGNFSAVVF